MSNEQQKLLDEAYEEYKKRFKDYWNGKHYDIPTKETFIDRLKNQEGFFKDRGLKIEEKELTLDERFEIFKKENNGSHPYDIEMMDDYDIPSKLITITYNNETIEIYEN